VCIGPFEKVRRIKLVNIIVSCNYSYINNNSRQRKRMGGFTPQFFEIRLVGKTIKA